MKKIKVNKKDGFMTPMSLIQDTKLTAKDSFMLTFIYQNKCNNIITGLDSLADEFDLTEKHIKRLIKKLKDNKYLDYKIKLKVRTYIYDFRLTKRIEKIFDELWDNIERGKDEYYCI